MSVVTSLKNNIEKTVVFNSYVAATEEELRECQKLRFEVFSGEMGANISTERPGIDDDYFDEYCKHLYVRNENTGEIIATTRILTSENALIAGKYYSQSEFDLKNILSLDCSFLEVGRTCVHWEYRTGAAINSLWQKLFMMLANSDADYLFGCFSIPMVDSGSYIDSLMHHLKQKYYAPEQYQVTPVHPLGSAKSTAIVDVVLPSLLKRYLNMGAYVCGEPCFDEMFNTADLFILLDRKKISARYTRYFIDKKK